MLAILRTKQQPTFTIGAVIEPAGSTGDRVARNLIAHKVEIPTIWSIETIAVSSKILVLAVSHMCGPGVSNEREHTSNDGSEDGGLHCGIVVEISISEF